MTEEEILKKLKEIFSIVVARGANLDNITMDSNIQTDLGVGSIGLIYFMVAVEQEFNVDMSNITMNTFTYVKDVVKYLKEHMNDK